jgi:5-hydroxyisourate hydrolase
MSMSMSPITTHVLDTARGTPGRGIAVILEVAEGAHRWSELARGTTGEDGRITGFEPPLGALEPGVFRLRFATGDYFAASHQPFFYPEVHVVVRIDDPSQHYHIPLLLSPFGYSTYRGR